MNAFGITKQLVEQMNDDEHGRLLAGIIKYALDVGIDHSRTVKDGDTWFECDDQRLASFAVGYLVALGFDENGIRHR